MVTETHQIYVSTSHTLISKKNNNEIKCYIVIILIYV